MCGKSVDPDRPREDPPDDASDGVAPVDVRTTFDAGPAEAFDKIGANECESPPLLVESRLKNPLFFFDPSFSSFFLPNNRPLIENRDECDACGWRLSVFSKDSDSLCDLASESSFPFLLLLLALFWVIRLWSV